MNNKPSLFSDFKQFLHDRNIDFELIEVEWSEFCDHEQDKHIMKIKLHGKIGNYTFYIKECESLSILTCRNASQSWYGYKSHLHAWMHFFDVLRQHLFLRKKFI